MRRSTIIVLFALVTAGAGTAFYVARPKNTTPAEASGRTVHPESRLIGTTVNATGTVRLRVGSEVRVGSQLSGIVKKLNVTVGSQVRAGEVIAKIDDAPVQARLADANAQTELDAATLERARVNSERAEKLLSQSLIPVQQAQDLHLALEEARAKYQKSLRDRDMVEVDLSYVDIRAPIAGIVASVSTQEGETVAAAFSAPTFVTIIGSNALQLIAVVDETDIASVRRGNPTVFTVDSYPSRDFNGVVESIAPKATILSGVVNYEVTIRITADAALLKPDMTANVAIRTSEHEALLLPSSAIQRDGEQSFVNIIQNGAKGRRLVVTGAKDGGRVEIKKGISPGDEIELPVDANTSMPAQAGS